MASYAQPSAITMAPYTGYTAAPDTVTYEAIPTQYIVNSDIPVTYSQANYDALAATEAEGWITPNTYNQNNPTPPQVMATQYYPATSPQYNNPYNTVYTSPLVPNTVTPQYCVNTHSTVAPAPHSTSKTKVTSGNRRECVIIRKHSAGCCEYCNPTGCCDSKTGGCGFCNCLGLCDRDRVTYRFDRTDAGESVEGRRKPRKSCRCC